MRRTLALIALLTMAALGGGCDRSDTASDANNANGDASLTGAGQTVSNSNMAPTGGPGPEPENAGSMAKSGNENKAGETAKNGNKR